MFLKFIQLASVPSVKLTNDSHLIPRAVQSYTRETWGFEEYIRLIGENKSNSLESLVNIALEKWMERL